MGNRRRFIKIMAGAALFAAVCFGVNRELSPSLSHMSDRGTTDTDLRPRWSDRSTASGTTRTADPRLRCAAALMVDNGTNEIVYSRNPYEVRPIASLTKLLTALVFLESDTDLGQVAEITAEDAYQSARSRLRPGEQYTLNDLLYAALLSSDNRAARALSRSAGMPQAKFIARMNDRARALGMDSTHVIEPTGLSEQNVSTAYDCAILVNAALRNHLIAHITSTPKHTIQAVNGKRRRRELTSTNRLLQSDLQFVGAKTGYISESGYCIAARARSTEGDDVTAVVLGAPSASQRFRSLSNALHWAFALIPSTTARP
jgi:D-alanyl-D-alanine endopeptidase (penicillin-binding protein 7)